jgi:hypothetical protein
MLEGLVFTRRGKYNFLNFGWRSAAVICQAKNENKNFPWLKVIFKKLKLASLLFGN